MVEHAPSAEQQTLATEDNFAVTQSQAIPVRRVRFCSSYHQRPESHYRPSEAFERSNKTSYRPGSWAATTGSGFIDTSGYSDLQHTWTPSIDDEFPWLRTLTPEIRRDIRSCRRATCGASSQTLPDGDQAETPEKIKQRHHESALVRALILRQELIGMEQTRAEWDLCCDVVLRPVTLLRRVFSGRLHPSACKENEKTSEEGRDEGDGNAH